MENVDHQKRLIALQKHRGKSSLLPFKRVDNLSQIPKSDRKYMSHSREFMENLYQDGRYLSLRMHYPLLSRPNSRLRLAWLAQSQEKDPSPHKRTSDRVQPQFLRDQSCHQTEGNPSNY
jgi:hypothetical protein